MAPELWGCLVLLVTVGDTSLGRTGAGTIAIDSVAHCSSVHFDPTSRSSQVERRDAHPSDVAYRGDAPTTGNWGRPPTPGFAVRTDDRRQDSNHRPVRSNHTGWTAGLPAFIPLHVLHCVWLT